MNSLSQLEFAMDTVHLCLVSAIQIGTSDRDIGRLASSAHDARVAFSAALKEALVRVEAMGIEANRMLREDGVTP